MNVPVAIFASAISSPRRMALDGLGWGKRVSELSYPEGRGLSQRDEVPFNRVHNGVSLELR
jgi:hypothetical protein